MGVEMMRNFSEVKEFEFILKLVFKITFRGNLMRLLRKEQQKL